MPTRDGAQEAERELLRACDSGLDVTALHRQVLRSLRRLMSVDAAFFATADPDTLLFTGAYAEAPLGSATEFFLRNELDSSDVNRFASLATSAVPVASLDGATGFDRWASPRYRDIMQPLGLGDELRAALVTDGRCWGYLCLHREDSRLGFAPAEIDLVTRLAPRVARGLRGAALLATSSSTTVDTAPGVVVLSEGLDVLASTPEAEQLLSLLPGAGRTRSRLPLAVRAVARALQTAERPGSGPPPVPRVRLRTTTGTWLTAHASWLSESPGERRISVVLAPARPADTVPLLLAAHGLTPREADVARLVLRGAPTATIVDTLHISRYTVQDHLRAVFDKVGVRSRRDLAGRLHAGA
ncbi:MAG: LuxR C-terminal-related transcriptional regulator [Blastococcus sp.]